MKAVILEDYAIQQGDLDWSGVEALVPDVTRYGRTAPEEVVPRIGDAEIVFLNKCRIDETVLARCPKLRWVGIIATGTDNLDLQACRCHGVAVANVPGYSTHSVAQMTFSLLLAICQCADRYDRLVQDGRWRTEDPALWKIQDMAWRQSLFFLMCYLHRQLRQNSTEHWQRKPLTRWNLPYVKVLSHNRCEAIHLRTVPLLHKAPMPFQIPVQKPDFLL